MNVEIRWLCQGLADVPSSDSWLSPGELARLAGMRFVKRRGEWRLGRWTAKCAILTALGLSCDSPLLASLEIRSASDGAPEGFLKSEPAPVSFSISHSSGRSLCTVGMAGMAVGCDLEMIVCQDIDFFEDYFTKEEMALLIRWPGKDRKTIATLIWSAKESALKCLRAGLRMDTRSVIVNLPRFDDPFQWNSLSVRSSDAQHIFHGWWRQDGSYINTIAADRAISQPIELSPPSADSQVFR